MNQLEKYRKDTETGERWFAERPVAEITRLRQYQTAAVEAIEKAMCPSKKSMLIAIGKGTNKKKISVSGLFIVQLL